MSQKEWTRCYKTKIHLCKDWTFTLFAGSAYDDAAFGLKHGDTTSVSREKEQSEKVSPSEVLESFTYFRCL